MLLTVANLIKKECGPWHSCVPACLNACRCPCCRLRPPATHPTHPPTPTYVQVLIKLMAAHLHREAHFQRMQEALRKVGALGATVAGFIYRSEGWVAELIGWVLAVRKV